MKRCRYFLALLAVQVALLSGCGNQSYLEEASEETTTSEETTVTDGVSSDTIFVHVEGAVVSPGVYELPEGSRVYEVIALAGGLTDDADAKSLNQARQLSDGEKIYVATTSEAASDEADDGRININTADADEMTALSGIGETRAQTIVEYRESHGAFSSIEDLMLVSGIGEATFEKLQDQIKVE